MVSLMDYKEIKSASYVGKPISNTVMYVTKKIEALLTNLDNVKNCLIFCEDTIDIPEKLAQIHTFLKTANPQLDYAKYVSRLAYENEQISLHRKYVITDGGYYIGENVIIGKKPIIEPLCLIDHDVIIGDNARIYSGAKIRNAIIGDNFIANENSVVGTHAFTMARDENNNRVRIPTLGKVIIGNNVEVGMLTNISVGTAGNTFIDDYVKIDSFVYIGHDVTLKHNVEITSGVIVGGFVTIENNVLIGINATLRNRITIGEKSIVGMGSVVTKSIPSDTTVVGNPAKPFQN
jgi:UDP-3-O-[3-hydroxymyristoyl] glucosamine N-acyltransferase